jgi:hypothetical protein
LTATRTGIATAVAALKEYVEGRGLSPRAAAADTGIPVNTLRRIIAGETTPQRHTEAALLAWFESREAKAGASEGESRGSVVAEPEAGARDGELDAADDSSTAPAEAVVPAKRERERARDRGEGPGLPAARRETSRRIVGTAGWARLEEREDGSATLTLNLCHPDTLSARKLYRLLEDEIAAAGAHADLGTTLGS